MSEDERQAQGVGRNYSRVAILSIVIYARI
jgi:hypothetical protein